MADQTTLIGTTGAELRPLGVRGEPLHGTAAQLRRVVRRRLGDATADLLADPQLHDDGSTIDWYAGWTGDVRPLADLEPERRAQVLAQVDLGLTEIDRLGATLAAAGGVDDATLIGRTLRLAAQRPGDGFVFLVGDRPVVTCWGYEKDAAGLLPPTPPPRLPESFQPLPQRQPVLAPDQTPQTPLPPAFAPAVIAAARPGVPWLRVLALALPLLALLLGAAWLLRGQIPADPALSLATREGPDAPPPGPPPPDPQPVLKASLSSEQAREKALRLELSAIDGELKKRVAACKPPEPPKPPQTALAPPPPPPVARPTPPPALREQPQASRPSDNRLRMPSAPTGSFAFLQGCWRTDPFYHERIQSQPGVSTYCFGPNGGGQLEWRRGRTACRTRAQANYSGATLLLRDADTQCNDGSDWYADQLVCHPGADNVAFCSGQSRGSFGRATWTVNLHKLN